MKLSKLDEKIRTLQNRLALARAGSDVEAIDEIKHQLRRAEALRNANREKANAAH